MAGMRQISFAALAMAVSLLVPAASIAVAAEPDPRAILAPSGTLRVALYPGTPTSILPDPSAGGPKGVGYDLGKVLASRLGVAYTPIVFRKTPRCWRRSGPARPTSR